MTHTKAGKALKPKLAAIACQLRREGWPIKAIAMALRVADSTVSNFVWFPEFGGSMELAHSPVKYRMKDLCPEVERVVQRKVEDKKVERQKEREANIRWARHQLQQGRKPWAIERPPEPQGEEWEALLAEQEREMHFRDSVPAFQHVVRLDACTGVHAEDATWGELVAQIPEDDDLRTLMESNGVDGCRATAKGWGRGLSVAQT